MKRFLPLLLMAGCATTAAEQPAAIPATTTTTSVAPLVQINEISLTDIDAAVAGAQSLVEEFVDPSPGAGVRFANTHTPAPPPAATTPSQPATPTVEAGSVEALICSYPWDCATALRVARCESGLNPGAVGSAGERGLLQIHPVHAPRLGERWHQLFTPAVNVQVAFEMWQTSGWQPWSCF